MPSLQLDVNGRYPPDQKKALARRLVRELHRIDEGGKPVCTLPTEGLGLSDASVVLHSVWNLSGC